MTAAYLDTSAELLPVCSFRFGPFQNQSRIPGEVADLVVVVVVASEPAAGNHAFHHIRQHLVLLLQLLLLLRSFLAANTAEAAAAKKSLQASLHQHSFHLRLKCPSSAAHTSETAVNLVPVKMKIASKTTERQHLLEEQALKQARVLQRAN